MTDKTSILVINLLILVTLTIYTYWSLRLGNKINAPKYMNAMNILGILFFIGAVIETIRSWSIPKGYFLAYLITIPMMVLGVLFLAFNITYYLRNINRIVANAIYMPLLLLALFALAKILPTRMLYSSIGICVLLIAIVLIAHEIVLNTKHS